MFSSKSEFVKRDRLKFRLNVNEFWILFVMREKAKYYYVPEFYKGAKQRHILKLLRASLLRQVVPMPGRLLGHVGFFLFSTMMVVFVF